MSKEKSVGVRLDYIDDSTKSHVIYLDGDECQRRSIILYKGRYFVYSSANSAFRREVFTECEPPLEVVAEDESGFVKFSNPTDHNNMEMINLPDHWVERSFQSGGGYQIQHRNVGAKVQQDFVTGSVELSFSKEDPPESSLNKSMFQLIGDVRYECSDFNTAFDEWRRLVKEHFPFLQV